MALKNEVTEIKEKILSATTCDTTTSKITETEPGSVYEATLPDKWTKEDVSDLLDHNANFVEASSLALGELSIGMMKDSNNVDHVNGTIEMINGSEVSVVCDRAKDKDTPFSIQTAYKVTNGSSSSDMKEVRKIITDMALDMLEN